MPSFWIPALKEYNGATKQWCIPRKGTPEYDEVKKIMDRLKAEAQRLPEKRKLRKPAEVEAEMEKPVVKRKLRMPKAEEAKMEKPEEPEMEPKIENIADIENFNNLWEYKSGATERAYYELVQTEPPLFKTRFIQYITEREPQEDGKTKLTRTYKVAEKGNVIRKAQKSSENEYVVFATSGANEGKEVAKLQRIRNFPRGVFNWLTEKRKSAPIETLYYERKVRKGKKGSKEVEFKKDARDELDDEQKELEEFIKEWEDSDVFKTRIEQAKQRLEEIQQTQNKRTELSDAHKRERQLGISSNNLLDYIERYELVPRLQDEVAKAREEKKGVDKELVELRKMIQILEKEVMEAYIKNARDSAIKYGYA